MTRGRGVIRERVRAYSEMLAEEMGVSEEDRAKLRWASLLHDIGKLKVSPDILNKPGKLDDDEWVEIKNHPTYGAEICGPLIDWLGPWSSAIVEHHERFDGFGYPAGFAGLEIALGGRVVAVADAYDVMTTARSYKKPMPAGAAREELARHAGAQFDPDVVRAFPVVVDGQVAVGGWSVVVVGAAAVPAVRRRYPKCRDDGWCGGCCHDGCRRGARWRFGVGAWGRCVAVAATSVGVGRVRRHASYDVACRVDACGCRWR